MSTPATFRLASSSARGRISAERQAALTKGDLQETHRDRPTLAELRAEAQKARHREIGNWLARRVGRPTAIYGTWLAVRLGLSANQVTAAAWLTSMAAA